MNDLTGRRFGRLIVLGPTDRRYCGNIIWRCRCDCGNEIERPGSMLLRKQTSSCGCYARDYHYVHGGKDTPEYEIWCAVKKRCLNPNDTAYRYYGGRGITICDRWKNSFASFIEDMGKRPSKEHSIDRIDDNKGYEPGNCRWATRIEQMNNVRTNHRIDVYGESLTIEQAARKYGLNSRTLYYRVIKGWDLEEAVSRRPSLSFKHKFKKKLTK